MTTTDRTRVNRPRGPAHGPLVRMLISLVLGAAAGSSFASASSDDPVTIQPDPAFQAAIASVMNATTETQRDDALHRLAELDDDAHQQLVQQLLCYSRQADNTKDAMASGVVLQRLGIADRAIVLALTPLLETKDPDLLRKVRNILGGFEDRAAGRRLDFSVYREILADRLRGGEPLPDGLVRYLYDSDPGEALLTLMRAHQLRQPEELKAILWAEHVVSDVLWKQQYGFLKPDQVEPAAIGELAKLSGHREWWVRLYVAEIVRQHPAFRQPELMDRLKHDEHALVRDVISAAGPPS